MQNSAGSLLASPPTRHDPPHARCGSLYAVTSQRIGSVFQPPKLKAGEVAVAENHPLEPLIDTLTGRGETCAAAPALSSPRQWALAAVLAAWQA